MTLETGALLAAAVMMILGTYYFRRKKTDRVRALACKAAATAMPGLLLLWSIAEGSRLSAGSAWALAAILFYMTADVLLESKFVLGAAAFGIGHICMTAGFLAERMDGAVLLTAAGFLCLFMGAAYLALHQYFQRLKAKKLYAPAVLYIFLLNTMAGCAAAYGILEGGWKGAAAVAGGVCFAVSDLLLGQNRLGQKRSIRKGAVVLILYYLAVYLFAISRIW